MKGAKKSEDTNLPHWKPVSEVQAKGEAQAAAVAAARETGEIAESDLQAMTKHVMDKADLEAGTCFGVPVPEDMLPVEVARLLCQLKAEKGLSIKNLPDVVIGPLLKIKLVGASSAMEERAEDEAETETKIETTDNYAEWRAQFSTSAEVVLATDTLDSGGSGCLNSFEPFRKWISRSVMPPPGLVTTG